MATDCQLAANLPAVDLALTESSSATGAVTASLPDLAAHITVGAVTPPPAMVATAATRDLLATATVV